jgi:tetratricopeptide (TPR) repeat protein
MAQPATNPKIEELRFRLKTDAKSRLFYPLAEELRKVGAHAEAEQVLRAGIEHHSTYLSAFVSLGRVLKELGKNDDAVPVLLKALQIDRENVVAARLLADTYLSLGEKVEAIKKFKLVHALMPKDEEIEAIVARLELELSPATPEPAVPEAAAAAPAVPPFDEPQAAAADESPFGAEPQAGAGPAFEESLSEESPFGSSSAGAAPEEIAASPDMPFGEESAAPDQHPFGSTESSVGGWEPAAEPEPEAPLSAFAEAPEVSDTPSPFAEPAGYGVDAFEVEQPAGMSIASEPLPWIEDDLSPMPSASAAPEAQHAVEAASAWGASSAFSTESGASEESPWGEQPSPSTGEAWQEPERDSPFASEPMPAAAEEPPPEPASEPAWATGDAPAAEPLPSWEEQLTHPAEELWGNQPAAEPAWETESFSPQSAQEQLETLAEPWSEPEAPAEPDVFAATAAAPADEPFGDSPAAEEMAEPSADEITDTSTMGDLYARQGLVDDARHVYERILQRDPANEAVREKLDALSPGEAPAAPPAGDPSRLRSDKVSRLEKWLARVRQESGDV